MDDRADVAPAEEGADQLLDIRPDPVAEHDEPRAAEGPEEEIPLDDVLDPHPPVRRGGLHEVAVEHPADRLPARALVEQAHVHEHVVFHVREQDLVEFLAADEISDGLPDVRPPMPRHEGDALAGLGPEILLKRLAVTDFGDDRDSGIAGQGETNDPGVDQNM
ncbi:hypothetical protein ACFQFG_18080 [Methylobacterium persicinum]